MSIHTLTPASAAKRVTPQTRTGRPAAVASIVALAAAIGWAYGRTLADLAHVWSTQADYSHGFLVPVFSLYLLWHRRALLSAQQIRGSWWGLALLVVAGGVKWASVYFFMSLLDAVSLLISLAGLTLFALGWAGLAWSWPAIVFLLFMIPLPGAIASRLSAPLQRIATEASTWLLQTLGMPAIARGNVIWLTDGQIGVVEACSGLRMLMLFAAITVGASFIIQRPLWEKCFVALSALAIGLLTNVIRITATAVLHEFAGPELAMMVFHDLAGWLMMPVAMLLLFLELQLLSKLLVEARRTDPVVVRR